MGYCIRLIRLNIVFGFLPATAATHKNWGAIVLESAIEKYLKRCVEKLGGLCWKFVSPGTDGVPDRIVLLNGRVIFVELKRPGETPRPLQLKRHAQLRRLGFEVAVLNSIPAVDLFIGELIAHCSTHRTSTRTIFPN
jgi:hypothetical protein